MKRQFMVAALSCLCLVGVVSTVTPVSFAGKGYTWKNAAIGGMGFVTGLVIHPKEANLIYIRTDVGGAFRWNATNSSWTPLMDSFGRSKSHYYSLESIALDPANPNVVYAAVGHSTDSDNGTVIKSTNRGQTWSETSPKTSQGKNVRMGGNEEFRWAGERLAVDPNNSNTVYFGSRQDGLYKSTNAAASWSKVNSFPAGKGITFVVFDKSAPQKVYVGALGSGVHQSSNAGGTCTLLPCSPRIPKRASVASNGTFYVSSFANPDDPEDNPGGVWKYTASSKGSGWRNITPESEGSSFSAITVDPTNPNIVLAANYPMTPDGVYRSVNAGSTWTTLKINATNPSWWPNWHLYNITGALVIDPHNLKRVWLTTGFGVLRTDDISVNPSSWSAYMTNLEELVTFVLKSPPVPGGAPLLSGVADMDGFRHESLTRIPSRTYDNAAFGDTTGMDFSEANPNIIARVGSSPAPGSSREDSQNRSAYSDNNGRTWTPFKNPPSEAVNGKIAVSATLQANKKPILVWAPQGEVPPHRSLDGGANWQPVKGAPDHTTDQLWFNNQSIASDRVDGKTFYMYGFNEGEEDGQAIEGAIYRSTDGGANWKRTVKGLPQGHIHTLKAAPRLKGEVWLNVEGEQLYRSSNAALSFTPLASVQSADNFAFGKPAPGRTNPTLFVYGKVNNSEGLFRSDNATSLSGAASSATWAKISTPTQGFGLGANYLEGDGLVYGRVYVGTGGRGIFYGQPN